MNHKLDTLKFVAPAFVVGVLIVAFSSQSLKREGKLDYEPNPGALAKSPFGRTIGMALQGPITRFWDRGVGSIEARAELTEGNRVDEKLFDWVTKMRETKTDGKPPEELEEIYQDYAMARIEKKLALAWKMDPRNYANYAIYQMFLWEGFASTMIESEIPVRAMSLQTLETSLTDEGSPLSLLTAAQASYDLVFAARTSKQQSPEEISKDIDTYGKLLPEIVQDYEEMVVAMKADGRWDLFSEAKKKDFGARKHYLDHLSRETKTVMENLTHNEEMKKGGRNS